MLGETIEIARDSGSVLRDLGRANPGVQQLQVILAAEIVALLDRREPTARAAQSQTGIAAADLPRIRNADWSRFTLDRLILSIDARRRKVEAQDLAAKVLEDHALDRFTQGSLSAPRRHQFNSVLSPKFL
jgi:hypothetical protein